VFSPSPTVEPSNSTNLCIGNRTNFTTPFGNCSIYYGNNLTYCPIDTDYSTNYFAKDVCSECGKCSGNQTEVFSPSPTVEPSNSTNLCIGNRTNFTTPFGNCSIYYGSNLQWCSFFFANDVCSECGKCMPNNSTNLPTETSRPTTSPTVVPNCEKDNGKKFEYRGDKYSCKQLNKTRRKYRKRICKRVKKANKLCPVICKYKT